MVETRGFEPLTPCVQTRISTDLQKITKRKAGRATPRPACVFSSAMPFPWLTLSYGGFRSFTLVAARGRHGVLSRTSVVPSVSPADSHTRDILLEATGSKASYVLQLSTRKLPFPPTGGVCSGNADAVSPASAGAPHSLRILPS